MVIVKLEGGLGNQLFQYAAGRRLAHKWNTELKFDLTIVGHPVYSFAHDHYRLGEFNVQENFATSEEIDHIKNIRQVEREASVYEVLNCPDNVYLAGFWQDERFFADIADIIRKELTPKKSFGAIAQYWQKKILAAECSVSLHIRHGDYLLSHNIESFGVLPFDYYRSCISELKKFFPELTAFVFVDKLNLAKKFLNLNIPTEFVSGDGLTDVEELYLMSLCQHNIIANSSFSWWGAWFNKNPNKKVFAPSPWFRDRSWKNELPVAWIKVPVEYGNLLSNEQPFLSIIVYVKNNASTLPLLLSSILNQHLCDCELILIDDGSTDGSEHICRKISLNKKVTLIASRGGIIGKATAWNRGLDYARGDYVLFLTGNDLILHNVVNSLCRAYLLQPANIFCSVQRMEENTEGNVTFEDIRDKTFRHIIDEPFKNFYEPVVFQIDNLYKKLMLMDTQTFNPLLGTKFFRRDFLLNNSLHFKENTQTDVELLFFVNAIMASEEIVFMPELFYVAWKK